MVLEMILNRLNVPRRRALGRGGVASSTNLRRDETRDVNRRHGSETDDPSDPPLGIEEHDGDGDDDGFKSNANRGDRSDRRCARAQQVR